MEFLSKDKLAALEEEKQQRRKARAEAAQARLAEVGKQTQQMVADHVSPNNADGPEQKQLRVGGLSRVLFEQAKDVDGRRSARKQRGGLDPMALQNAGQNALKTIDQAVAHINSVTQDVTGAGMRGGLEDAARSVNDAVNRVSAAVNLAGGGRQHAAQNNPLADLMQQEAEEQKHDQRGDQEQERAEALQPNKGAELEMKARIGGMFEANAAAGGVHFGLDVPSLSGLGHEASHVIQQRAGGLAQVGKQLGEETKDAAGQLGKGLGTLGENVAAAPGQVLANATSAAAEVGERAANAPRSLLQAAQNLPREALDRATNVPREALDRAADAPRQIAENLRDAPAHVLDNVHQIAHHVAHGRASIASELKDVVERPLETVHEAVHNLDPRNVVDEAKSVVRETAQSLDPKNAIESARDNIDPRKLASQAAADLDPRHIVDGAVNAARSVGIQGAEVARNLDPRTIAEQTIAAVDPRAQVRGNADPNRVLENATGAAAATNGAQAAAGTQVGAQPANGAQPAAGAQPANANGAQPATPATNAATNAATKSPATGATPATGAKTETKHTEEAKQHAPAHGGAGGAAHAATPAAHAAATPHTAAPAHGGGVQAPPPSHSGAAMPTRNPTGAAPPQPAQPAPSPSQRPLNTTPASERQASAPHVQPSKDRTPTEMKSNGDMQVNAQPVASQAPPIADKKAQLTQPSFQIEAKSGDNGQVPTPPPAPTPPTTNAPVPAPAAPPVQTTQPTTSQRAVPPLAPPSPTAAPAANPAIAAARAATSAVAVPQGSTSPLPASNTSTAPGAAPAPAAAAPAGPGAIKTAATPAPTPPPAAPAIAALPATPTPAAPQTNAPAPAAPTVAPVKSGGGGDSIPDPGSMVQQTVSLSSDRSASASAITAEAQTQSKVAPEAAAARASQIAPLGPQMQTTGHSADAPMASANSSSQAAGQSAAATGKASEAAKDAQGKAQIASQMGGAQAERSQFAAMPPPPILQQTSAAAMAPVTQAAQTAIQSAASAVSQSAANLDPAVIARGHAAGAANSTLPPFDASRFAAIDQHPALPPPNSASVDAATAAAQGTYQQANAQIQNLANIPPPVITAAQSPNAGEKTPGGYPTREAAIADIEQQVTSQSNAQGPGQMKAAAAPVQDQLNTHVSTSQSTAQSQTQSQVSQAQSQAQEIAQRPPPITGAQAAAQAQPQYEAHQAEATAAHTQMQSQIATSQQTAQTGVTTAKAQRNASVQAAQTGYTQEVQGQVMPQYSAAQASAQQTFQQQKSTAETTLATDQQTAQTQAQAQAEAAKAKADADIASHQSQLQQQQQQAYSSHQQQAAAATASHQAQMTQQQAQMDAQVQQHQSEMHSQVASQQAQGQQEINQHLTEGEQGYQQQIQQGTAQANAEKAKAEQEAAAKKAQADEEKKKHSGGILGGIVGWVKDRVDDLMNAVKSVLEAAKNLVVSIMEKARQAAMAVLEKARQAALAVMNKVKGAIQGIISACAAAIRTVINACAAAIKGIIQALASALQALVAALTQMLTALVSAFQMAINAALDMMIAAVSLVNKDLGDKLRSATQKYRDAFNGAMDGLKANIDRAGQALQHGIQAAADKACSAVDAAAKVLDDAVTQVENTLNSAVEAAYQLGVKAINTAFDAAEAVVNTAFDIAEAGVKAFFDAQIAQLDVLQKGIDAVADFVGEMADKVMEAVDKIAQAVVSMIPDSWKKAFVDFWNGPWRSVIIIGLATVAAVALTVATGGLAGVLIAGLVGGSIAGGAYFGGEAVARESEISLSTEGKGMYIPGAGYAQIGPDGKPIPPPGMTPEQLQDFQKQSGWATSNFNMERDANGNVTGYDRKSGTEVMNYALEEGAKGFVEGAISGSLAVAGGGLGGLASKGLGLAEEGIASSLVSAGVSNVVTGPIQNSLTTGFDAAFEAIKEGKSPAEAFRTGLSTAGNALKDPTQWATAALTMGVAPAKLKFLEPLLGNAAKQTENKVAQYVIKKGGEAAFDTVANTLTAAGGAFAGKYAEALAAGKSQSEALAEARKAANDAFSPEAIATNAFMSTAGAIGAKEHAHPGEGEHPAGEHPAGEHPAGDHPTTEAHPNGEPTNEHPQTTASSTERTSSDPSPTPKTEPNQSTQHTSPETKPEEHPHTTADSTPRASDKSPVPETPPKETGGTTIKDPAEDKPAAVVAADNKNEAPQRQLHEPPTKQISEHEPRLKAIEHNPDGAPPAAVEAVREARAEIKRLKNLRTRAENGTGVWEHATPEERSARVKTLEDQINNTANHAIEQYDRVANQPASDAEVLGRIQSRTPEQVEARRKEVAQAREETKARDAELTRQVNGNVERDAAGKIHVKEVYDHITLGSGFAGTANEMSRPNVKPGDIVIGGANPWDGATSKFGQAAGQSELPNHQPGHGMIETSSDPNRRYMLASEHADNVALNKNDAQVKTYNGSSGSLEPGPKADWPSWAKEGGANARMEVTDPDGTKRYFYTKQADVATGPGPNRKLPESVMDAATLKRMQDAKAFAFGDQAFGGESVRPGEVANIGAGAAGAWGSEAAANRVNEHGVRVNDVEWIGTHPDEAKQNAGTQRDKLAAINRELADAQTANDAPRIKAAQDALTKFTFEEAARNGNLPRNREPGAAFDPHMQKGNTSPEGVQGNISRRVVEGIDKITYEPEVPGGPDRVKIVLKEKGPNGEPVVLWKDSLVLSIGQDARGKGGPVELVKNYQGKLLPIYGEPDANNFRPIVGVRSEDGSVRILGAASTPEDISHMMNHDTSAGGVSAETHQDNLRSQADQLHPDSKGVVPGFVLMSQHIEAANKAGGGNARLAEPLQQTAQQQREAANGGPKKPGIPLSTEPIEAKGVHEMSPAERQAARDKYPEQIKALEADGTIPMPRGKASVDMMASITAATGREVALLRLPNGERVMKLGGEHTVDLPEGAKIIAHTHPGGNLELSPEDIGALHGAGQHSSVLIGADGKAARFRTGDGEGARSDGQLHESVRGDHDPHAIKYSQENIKHETSDGMSLEQLKASMAEGGWKGAPIDAVTMPDGTITSLDNRRLRAAREAIAENGGIPGPDGQKISTIPVNVHGPNDAFPADWAAAGGWEAKKNIYKDAAGNFTFQKPSKDAQPAIKKGDLPKTYGEAIAIRAAKQGNFQEGELKGQKFPVDGTKQDPRIRYPKPDADEGKDEGTVQRKASGDAGDGDIHAIARSGTSGSGGALPHHDAIQRSFGRHDVSGVRAHVGGSAAEASAALGATAYAHGDAVAFSSSPDLHTAAHEAAHVVQQRAGVSKAGGIDGGAHDEHERHADAVADRVVAGESAEALLDQLAGHVATTEAVQRKAIATPVVQRREDPGTAVIAREMTSKEKAAEMLRATPPADRATTESIIRSKFSKEDADEIISKNPSTGADHKPKQANGKPVKPGGNKSAKGKGAAKKPGGKGAGGAKTAPVVAKVAEKHEEGINDIGAFKGVSTSDLALIHQELIEHEEWKSAQSSVGGAGSTQRAAFIAEQTGKGVFGAGATGFALGAGGALLTEGVGKGAGLALTKLGVSAAGEEIPGIGPIIAGAFSAYSLWTKNWKEAGETISAMGTGADRYEKLANTLAGIAEIIDIVVNVLNVVAGVTAAIGLVMWIVTIITLGAAAPLAITLTEIAAGVVMATLILDAIAKLVINPMVLLFRAMHTFQSEADPRSVQQQGDKLSETANQTVGFVGNMLGAKAGEAGVEKVKDITAPKPAGGSSAAPPSSGGEQPHTPPETTPEAAPAAKTETDPHAGKPPEGEHTDPHAGKAPEDPHGAKPEEDPNAPKSEADPDKPAAGDTRTREQKLADAKKKLEDARAARKKVADDYKKSYEENRAARKEAAKAHDEAKEQNEKDLHKKLDDIETARKAKVDKIEADRKAELDKLGEQTKTADERLANAERARDSQHAAAAKTKEAEIEGAKSKLDGKSQAAQDKLSAAETDARAQANHGADKELAQRDSEVEAKHAESLKHINGIEDPEIRQQHVAEEQERYLADKHQVAQDKAARAAELAKPSSDAAKAEYEREVAAAKSEYDGSVEKATDAEAKANAKTDRAFDAEKAAHAKQEAQIAKATKKVNGKSDADAKRVNEGAEKDTDTANDERAEADKTADENLEHKNEHLDEENAEARKQRHERDEDVEKAEAERDKNQWPPWRIIKKWAINPLWEPFSPSKNFEKGHKDIDILAPWETKERNAKAVEEAAKKKEEAKQEAELRPHDPEVEGAPPEKEGEEEKKKHEADVARNQKIGGIVGGGIGLFAGGLVAAPWSIPGGAKRGRDFGEGLAGKEPESREQIERKVSPKYVDPPGSEKDLADAKAQIEADMAARAQWATKKSQELAMQGKEKHNSEQIAEAQKMAKEATEASNQHKEAVAAKDAAIAAQKQRSDQAGQQGADGAHRLAGMTIIEVPLKAFQGFTWIGAKLGSTKFQEMNNDANNFATKLAEMKKTISGSQESSKAEGAAIDKDKQTNAATKAKGVQTAANMTKTETGFATAKTRVDGAVATRGANAAAAEGQMQKSDNEAKNAQTKYQDMSAKLTAWAKQHQQARLAAKADAYKRDAAEKGRAPGGEKGGEKPGEKSADKPVAGEPRGVQPAPAAE